MIDSGVSASWEPGEIIYEAKQGQVVLENNAPVIDKEAGILRLISVLMLEQSLC